MLKLVTLIGFEGRALTVATQWPPSFICIASIKLKG